jgi:hypothetical protein
MGHDSPGGDIGWRHVPGEPHRGGTAPHGRLVRTCTVLASSRRRAILWPVVFQTAGALPHRMRWDGAVVGVWVGDEQLVDGVLLPNGDIVAVTATAGGVTVNRVARWNGSAWSSYGTGMTGEQSTTSAPAQWRPCCCRVLLLNFVNHFIASWNGSAWLAWMAGQTALPSMWPCCPMGTSLRPELPDGAGILRFLRRLLVRRTC